MLVLKIVKLAVAAGLMCACVSGAYAQVVAAKLSAPVPVTAQSGQPFRGTNEQPVAGPGLTIPDLIPHGYMEEEYFVSGTVDGKPYTTSMLVRRPKDPKKFSGLVAVETVHAQGAVPFWGSKQVWMRGGHGWVAVASQRVALEQYVKKSNPTRYASLQLPEAPPPPAGTSAGPAAGGAQDLISQAIMTQVGALLKSSAAKAANGPFPGLAVKYLVMGGSSQTGGTTLRYIQNSHAKSVLPNGKFIYDGYMPQLSFATGSLTAGGPPILHVVTEGDLMNQVGQGRVSVLRPDSDAASDRYRHFQLTGDSHVGTRGVKDPLQIFPTLGGAFKPGEQLSQYPASEAMMPLTQHFIDWVMKGTPPPRAKPIEVANGQIVRDARGIAVGGVRSPYVDVPTVRYIAAAPLAQGDNPFRRLIGLQEPLPADQLRSLYKSRDAYLRQFNTGIDKMVAARFLFPADAARLKAEEAKSAPQF